MVMMNGQCFVILDRDGTLIEECHYLSDPDQVMLIKGAGEALCAFKRMGLGIIIVTNQSALGRGLFDRSRLELIHERLISLLKSEGASVDGIYVCPHVPEDDCLCRKPRTGLLEQAAREHGFKPRDCFVIGDKACDIELGKNAGAMTFLVRTGHGQRTIAERCAAPDFVVGDLREASHVIETICAPPTSGVEC
jgi:D-glycero-D-manno-heptose 1,7-bisphosphate phosphatase